jgi:hypothetical protein
MDRLKHKLRLQQLNLKRNARRRLRRLLMLVLIKAVICRICRSSIEKDSVNTAFDYRKYDVQIGSQLDLILTS